jgi:2-keto-4-pentenoate hydratase
MKFSPPYEQGARSRRLLPAIPIFRSPTAYRIARTICDLRAALGERPVGRKIGFTDRNAWPEV